MNAIDQLVNHLDKMFRYPMLIRAIVGSKEPLDPGPQHVGDYTKWLLDLRNIRVCHCDTVDLLKDAYTVYDFTYPQIIIEYRKLF